MSDIRATFVVAMFGENLDGALALSSAMSGAWAAFARTGVPSVPGLPYWTACDEPRREAMVFDTVSQAVSDPQFALRTLFRP